MNIRSATHVGRYSTVESNFTIIEVAYEQSMCFLRSLATSNVNLGQASDGPSYKGDKAPGARALAASLRCSASPCSSRAGHSAATDGRGCPRREARGGNVLVFNYAFSKDVGLAHNGINRPS